MRKINVIVLVAGVGLLALGAEAAQRKRTPTPPPEPTATPVPPPLFCTEPYRAYRRSLIELQSSIATHPTSTASVIAYRRDVQLAASRVSTEKKLAPPWPALLSPKGGTPLTPEEKAENGHNPAFNDLELTINLMLLDQLCGTTITFATHSRYPSTDHDVTKWYTELLKAQDDAVKLLDKITSCEAPPSAAPAPEPIRVQAPAPAAAAAPAAVPTRLTPTAKQKPPALAVGTKLFNKDGSLFGTVTILSKSAVAVLQANGYSTVTLSREQAVSMQR